MSPRERLEHSPLRVPNLVERQRRILRDYGVEFDLWACEQHDVRDRRLPEKVLEEFAARGLSYEQDGALWFRSTQNDDAGDDKDRVLRRTSGEVTYFAVDVAYHQYVKFADADRVINLFGPDHHGYLGRMRAAMQALGHPPESFAVLIVQLVTLLRDGQPVRMSKRRGEFVLMEELLEEVGRDAARFTFLTRRHDSPLEFDLAVATRQSSDNPVFYVQYAHARSAPSRARWRSRGSQRLRGARCSWSGSRRRMSRRSSSGCWTIRRWRRAPRAPWSRTGSRITFRSWPACSIRITRTTA